MQVDSEGDGSVSDTIFALSTGAGRAAIAVVRVSGPLVRDVLSACTGSVPAERRGVLRKVRAADGGVIDHALILFFAGPRSETGEDMAEFQLHGSRAVVQAMLSRLDGFSGLRPAEPGEFARRALFNGKMSLLDAEALADLIDSDTEDQRRQALEGGGSLLRGKAEHWRRIILGIRSDLEAGIDFSDEGDVAEQLDSSTERSLSALLAEFKASLAQARHGERIRDGFRVAVLGSPNAGKSSLINALARRDVAIVSNIPGTTRDRLEVHFDLHGAPVTLMDTAGLRDSSDSIELEGMRRAVKAAQDADLVLWLSPVDCPEGPPNSLVGGDVRIVTTKADLTSQKMSDRSWCAVSSLTGDGVEHLLRLIEDEARSGYPSEPVVLTRARHVACVTRAHTHLQKALATQGAEFQAEELRVAELALEQLLGRTDVDDVLGDIFSRFCVGK